MNKREAKKLIYRRLASSLRNCLLADTVLYESEDLRRTQADADRLYDACEELAAELERRAS